VPRHRRAWTAARNDVDDSHEDSYIQAAVPIYRRADIVTTEQLRQASLANIEVIFTELGGAPATSSTQSYDNGRARARAGVPLTAVMAAYRVAAAFQWEKLAQTARDSCAGAEVIVAAATQMWLVLDTFTTEMADGYREEITAQAIVGEQQRASLVQAILHGQLTDTNLWEAAEMLRLPPQGTYTVITQRWQNPNDQQPTTSPAALPYAASPSAWALTHDTEVGIALTRDPVSDIHTLIAVLRETNRSHVGISPVYHSHRQSRGITVGTHRSSCQHAAKPGDCVRSRPDGHRRSRCTRCHATPRGLDPRRTGRPANRGATSVAANLRGLARS
jgi:hypothetical protein